ncbi:MAG TPA: oxidative damage protection protein [Terriglobales bacterium]|nr:oxidative damage protection protein [Terriglobales bacterium]
MAGNHWTPAGNQTGRTVFCVKFQRELPGLDEPPFNGELGDKIYQNVSAEAWKMWSEHCKMILNEYRLNPANKQDQELIVKQMEQYFFGEGAALPANYVPQQGGHGHGH